MHSLTPRRRKQAKTPGCTNLKAIAEAMKSVPCSDSMHTFESVADVIGIKQQHSSGIQRKKVLAKIIPADCWVILAWHS
jgi:hypothetical protein